MTDKYKQAAEFFEKWLSSFSGLTGMQEKNFQIKKDHSLRVANNAIILGNALKLSEEDIQLLYIAGLFHDIGRFKQLADYNTFNDNISVDHAALSVQIIEDENIPAILNISEKELLLKTVQLHNKFEIPGKLSVRELLFVNLLRDADKLDILKVLTDYYMDTNREPNHTLTWELPKGDQVSPDVAQDLLAERLISKKKVKSEIDVKIMQMSWVYDLNFKPSFDIMLKNRYLEKIYKTLPKNDLIIKIYTRVKVFAENKVFQSQEKY